MSSIISFKIHWSKSPWNIFNVILLYYILKLDFRCSIEGKLSSLVICGLYIYIYIYKPSEVKQIKIKLRCTLYAFMLIDRRPPFRLCNNGIIGIIKIVYIICLKKDGIKSSFCIINLSFDWHISYYSYSSNNKKVFIVTELFLKPHSLNLRTSIFLFSILL